VVVSVAQDITRWQRRRTPVVDLFDTPHCAGLPLEVAVALDKLIRLEDSAGFGDV